MKYKQNENFDISKLNIATVTEAKKTGYISVSYNDKHYLDIHLNLENVMDTIRMENVRLEDILYGILEKDDYIETDK